MPKVIPWFKATVEKIEYFISTDKDKRHLNTPAYFEENLGSYPYPTIIFPKQENLKFIYGADCSPSAERIYFNVVIIYKGYKEDKNYWYSFTSKYAAISTPKEQEVPLKDGTKVKTQISVFSIIPLQLKGDWDKNLFAIVPNVYKPDWQLEEKQVIKQREFLK